MNKIFLAVCFSLPDKWTHRLACSQEWELEEFERNRHDRTWMVPPERIHQIRACLRDQHLNTHQHIVLKITQAIALSHQNCKQQECRSSDRTDLLAGVTAACCSVCSVAWWLEQAYAIGQWRGRWPVPRVCVRCHHQRQERPGHPPWRCWKKTCPPCLQHDKKTFNATRRLCHSYFQRIFHKRTTVCNKRILTARISAVVHSKTI